MVKVETTLDEESYNYIKSQNLTFNTLIKLGLAQFQAKNQLTKEVVDYINQAMASFETKFEERIKEANKKHTETLKEKVSQKEAIDLIEAKSNELKQAFESQLSQLSHHLSQAIELKDKETKSMKIKLTKINERIEELTRRVEYYIDAFSQRFKPIEDKLKLSPKKSFIDRVLGTG